MNNKKLVNFIIFLPFAISIGAFILYLRYLFLVKGAKTIKVTEVLGISLVRYRNIALFCLFIGIVLLFIKTLYNYFKSESNITYSEAGVLNRISSKVEDNYSKYTFDENTIISDLLGKKKLKARFINSSIDEKMVIFKNYDKKKNIIEFYDLSKEDKKVKEKNKKVKNKKTFNPVTFAVNMIIILLCIIILLLCVTKIKNQSEINKENLNIKTVQLN